MDALRPLTKPISGKAYGVFDVKWLFLSLVVLFEVGSVVCGAAPNMNAFIVGRVIQGIGTSTKRNERTSTKSSSIDNI